ncbi:translation elongation factor Ts [Neolewinella agarilytica]|uniref:Elongation factor Ts n=1 Tax=Neolewinella agarilytica TaxID=478744 RepID=A0A1H9FQR8_9BACT|nr:translation elongation factor Ts [Neolewinella agarilytica]SEQ39778.1 elongation factor Ts [Neolewinella agarilytica]
MAISAQDVKKLRDMTGSGMMDCKKALAEADGDFDKAIEVLRKRGEKVAAKRGDRDANEGAVIAKISDDKTYGIIIRLSSETDFVSKNDDFVAFAHKIADVALAGKPADLNALMALPMEGDLTIQDKVTEMVGKINEKINVTAYEQLSAPLVAEYIHMGNRAGVLVGLSASSDAAYDAGRSVAMQAAAMKPIALDKENIDQATQDKEIDIAKELARQEGKPEAMLDKIAMGRLNKFFKEKTLVNQQFVKDNKKTVKQFVAEVEKGLEVTDFKHVELV